MRVELLNLPDLHRNGPQSIPVEIRSPVFDAPASCLVANLELVATTPRAGVKHLAHLLPRRCSIRFRLRPNFNCCLHPRPLVLLASVAVGISGVGTYKFALNRVVSKLLTVVGILGIEGISPVVVGVGKPEVQVMVEGFVDVSEQTPLLPTHDVG